MATITDNDLALFCERAKTELRSTGDVGRLAWDDIVEALCKEVARLRSVSKERGDCAKLREVAEFVAHIDDNGYTSHDVQCAIDKARAAIAAPARNCEVGTAEEQAQRFHQFCMARQSPNTGVCVLTCPCTGLPDKCHCMAKWAQLPYESEAAK